MSFFARKSICSVLIASLFLLICFVSFLQGAKAVRFDSTVWYFRNTTALANFSTTGPTAEYSGASDLISGSPASKTTALAMTETPGSSVSLITATDTTASAGNIWMATFLSPKLASQTLSTGAIFRIEGALAENNLAANMILRAHIYLWREGTGYVTSFFDGVSATNCGIEPGAASSIRSQVCLTPATSSDVSIQDGDQIAIEIWVNDSNTVTTSYTATFYDNGINFVGNGSASHVVTSPATCLSVSQYLYLQAPLFDSTVWYLSSDTSESAFGTIGPTSEQSSASDIVSGSPAAKSTALSMSHYPGNAQTSIAFSETTTATGMIWLGTFLSPLLAAQTIPAATTFRFESGLLESSLSANFIERIHIYLWRDGTGYVSSFFDGVLTTNCGIEPGAAASERSEVCVTSVTASAVTLQDGDQIALEVWIYDNNTSATAYSGNLYYGGNGFIENGAASHVITSAMSALYVSKNVSLLDVLSVDIVDAGGATVGSPSVTMSGLTFSDSLQVATGSLGTADEKIRVSNWSDTNTWTLSIAATLGSTALWSSDGLYYDYNDPGGAFDGADSDSVGGQLTIDPSAGVLAAGFGCSSTTGISKGSSGSFDEIAPVSSISLLIAGSSASYNCGWDFTGASLSQSIPGRQVSGTYTISLTLTIL